jgi:hypothetical protein
MYRHDIDGRARFRGTGKGIRSVLAVAVIGAIAGCAGRLESVCLTDRAATATSASELAGRIVDDTETLAALSPARAKKIRRARTWAEGAFVGGLGAGVVGAGLGVASLVPDDPLATEGLLAIGGTMVVIGAVLIVANVLLELKAQSLFRAALLEEAPSCAVAP